MTYIDSEELAVRIAEAVMSNTRPVGMSAQAAMKFLRGVHAESADGFERAALAAATYIAECCNAENPGQVEVNVAVVNRSATEMVS